MRGIKCLKRYEGNQTINVETVADRRQPYTSVPKITQTCAIAGNEKPVTWYSSVQSGCTCHADKCAVIDRGGTDLLLKAFFDDLGAVTQGGAHGASVELPQVSH
jgi:hypothetical protein